MKLSSVKFRVRLQLNEIQLPLQNLSARLSLLVIGEESPDSKGQHTG